MSMHRLKEFESDFLQDGSRAVCACGWRSKRCRDDSEALSAFKIHKQEVGRESQEDTHA
jgi:hypothetical protein